MTIPLIPKAFYWYAKAAEQGYASAQCEAGLVCKQNKKKARYWLTKAAEQGNGRAKSYLADLDSNLKAFKGGCYITTKQIRRKQNGSK